MQYSTEPNPNSSTILHTLEPKHIKNIIALPIAITILVLTMLLAFFSGNIIAKSTKKGSVVSGNTKTNNSQVVVATEVGLKEGKCDQNEFPDTAEGIVREGGLNSEGTHQLEREGGPSKTATLTSSTVNLDNYIGKKVKVCGKTFNSQKVAWLLDIGYIEAI